jgi:hypothetical protein
LSWNQEKTFTTTNTMMTRGGSSTAATAPTSNRTSKTQNKNLTMPTTTRQQQQQQAPQQQQVLSHPKIMKKTLLDWYSGAAELFTDRLTCCSSSNYQTQVVLDETPQDDESSVVEGSAGAVPSRANHNKKNNNNNGLMSLQQDAAQWQQALKRQSYDSLKRPSSSHEEEGEEHSGADVSTRGRPRQRRAGVAGPSTMLLMPCSSCLSSIPMGDETSWEGFVNDHIVNVTTPSSALPLQQQQQQQREAPEFHQFSSKWQSLGGSALDRKKGGNTATPKPSHHYEALKGSPKAVFDMTTTIPFRSVPSFGTATTTSMTTCTRSNCTVEEHQERPSPRAALWMEVSPHTNALSPPLPASIPMLGLGYDDEDDHDWDADSTTTTEIVSHRPNPFRERQASPPPSTTTEDNDTNLVFRCLMRMSPRHYVHDSDEDEGLQVCDYFQTNGSNCYDAPPVEDYYEPEGELKSPVYPMVHKHNKNQRQRLRKKGNADYYNTTSYAYKEENLWYENEEDRSSSLHRVQQQSNQHGFSCEN